MPSLKSLAAAAPLLLLVACATARIDSNVRAGYSRKLDRVYVLASTSDHGSLAFMNALKETLTAKLSQAGVASKVHVYDNLKLDEKETIKNEVVEFAPNFTMDLTQTSKTTLNGGNAGAAFELAISELGADSFVWKAQLEIGGGGHLAGMAPGLGNPDKTADEIVNRLIQDGLIKAAPAPAK